VTSLDIEPEDVVKFLLGLALSYPVGALIGAAIGLLAQALL
jgi:hypothetical protein